MADYGDCIDLKVGPVAENFETYFVGEFAGLSFPDALVKALTPAAGGVPVAKVVTYPGYRSLRVSKRGVSRPVGFLVHWTAGRDSRQLCIDDKLVTLYIQRAGTIEILSNGRTGHPGDGNQDVLDHLAARKRIPWARHRRGGTTVSAAYASLLGVEVEDLGIEGKPTDFAKWDTAWQLSAALCRIFGWPATSIIDHAMWTSRKVDSGLIRTGDPSVLEIKYVGAGEPHTGRTIEHAVEAQRWLDKLTGPRSEFLQRGDTGDAVKQLQKLLNHHGADLVVDGDFGPATEDMLRNFQRAAGVPVSLVLDVATMSRLSLPVEATLPAVPPPPPVIPPPPAPPVADVHAEFNALIDRALALTDTQVDSWAEFKKDLDEYNARQRG